MEDVAEIVRIKTKGQTPAGSEGEDENEVLIAHRGWNYGRKQGFKIGGRGGSD